jgi:hypothetical protein
MAGCGQRCPACPSGSRSRDTGVIRTPPRVRHGAFACSLPRRYLVKRLMRQIGTLSLRLNSDSELPEVESAGFHRGSFGGTGSGVADEHVGAGPAGDGHESGFGAACGEPAVRRGVPQPVGTEALDAGAHGSASQRAREAFAAELLAAIAQPESGEGGEGMPLAFAEVPQERLGGGLADRDAPTAPAFAATDRDQATDDVDVVELEVDHLAGADRGLEHEPDDGFVAAMVQGVLGVGRGVGQCAGRDEGAELVVGLRLHDRRFDTGALTPGNGSVWISPPAVSQEAKRRTASCRMRAVPGARRRRAGRRSTG